MVSTKQYFATQTWLTEQPINSFACSAAAMVPIPHHKCMALRDRQGESGCAMREIFKSFFYNRMVAAPLVPEAFKVGSKVRDYSIGV